MSVTNIELYDELEQPITLLAEKLNQSRNWIINEAVKEFLEHQALEELRWQETLPALASVKNGNSIAGEKVEAWLASWGTSQEHPTSECFLYAGSKRRFATTQSLHCREKSRYTAQQIATDLLAGIAMLKELPYLGRKVEKAPKPEIIRDLSVSLYIVRYLILGDEIHILRIWHKRENWSN